MIKFKNIEFKPYLDGVSARVIFGNITLSIVRHSCSYGFKKGLYEIGIIDKNYRMINVPGVTAEGDTVKGFLTEQDVEHIIVKLQEITGTSPVVEKSA